MIVSGDPNEDDIERLYRLLTECQQRCNELQEETRAQRVKIREKQLVIEALEHRLYGAVLTDQERKWLEELERSK